MGQRAEHGSQLSILLTLRTLLTAIITRILIVLHLKISWDVLLVGLVGSSGQHKESLQSFDLVGSSYHGLELGEGEERVESMIREEEFKIGLH